MKSDHRLRRLIAGMAIVAAACVLLLTQPDLYQTIQPADQTSTRDDVTLAVSALETLPVKGRAVKTGYSRDQFGGGWETKRGCDTRNIILHRDLTNVEVNDECQVVRGTLHDPYTGKDIIFQRGSGTSSVVQIDHVVALSDAWQSGAQLLTSAERQSLANDPLELLAVDGKANQQKLDGDAATWLPANKPFRCQYIARQIAVKLKYHLWVKPAEKAAMNRVLQTCPGQALPTGTIRTTASE